MAMKQLVAALALFAAAINGQKTVAWTEPASGVEYNIGIPEAAAAPFDVYVSNYMIQISQETSF